MTIYNRSNLKQIGNPHQERGSRFYVTKIIPPTPGISCCIMWGDIHKDSQKAGLTFREYLWKIVCEWENPSDDRITHWQLVLCDLQPTYYKHCYIVDYPQFKGAAQTLLRCLQYMEQQDFELGRKKFGIEVAVHALH